VHLSLPLPKLAILLKYLHQNGGDLNGGDLTKCISLNKSIVYIESSNFPSTSTNVLFGKKRKFREVLFMPCII